MCHMRIQDGTQTSVKKISATSCKIFQTLYLCLTAQF